MLEYLKYLVQLLLSPARGWEDISAKSPDPEEMTRKGLYPLIGIAAVSEFCAFFYLKGLKLDQVLVRAVLDFGTYFVSVFIAKLIYEIYLGKVIDGGEPNPRKTASLTVFPLGLMVLLQIVENCLQANLTFLKFLPLYVILVLYKAIPYMGVKPNDELRFTGIASVATVVVPLAIYYLLDLIVF